MQDIIKEFQEEYENAKKEMAKALFYNADFQSLSTEEYAAIKTMLNLLDVSERFIIAQAETIDEINKKLDRRG